MELDFEQLYGFLEQTTRTKVFPFIIRNGYQNVSERGFEEKGTPSYFFSFFQKVFTGTETITATWEDSTQLNVRDASLGTYNYDFQVGKYFEGVIVPSSEMNNTEISNVSGNDSFLAMQTNGDINVLFFRNAEEEKDTDFIFDEDYLYKLYIMPETKFGNKWLYISNISTSISPANPNLMIEVVTFSSLKDKLETSGRAIEQYVQYAAPGEPYAFPYITSEGEVIVSPLRLSEYTMNPVKYLQVELQGANAFSSITVLGRRLYWDSENLKWYTSPSKFLLPYRFANPQGNPFAKTSSPTKNFYCFPNETIQTRSTTEWLEAIKKQSNELSPIQNMGSFTMSAITSWDSGVHKSNTLTNEAHYDYFNSNWRPLSWISDDGITISTRGNVYSSDTVKYTKTDTMQQILIKNSMANITQLELPLDMKQTKPYRWSTFRILGFWTRWFGDRAMNANTTQVKTNNICYFIDTNLATMQYNAFTQPTGENAVAYGNLQMFSGENAPAGLNPQSANTTICFELSDKVSFTDALYYDQTELANGIDTAYLSQKTNPSLTNLHTDGTACVLNCGDDSLNVKYVDYGFVIDNVIVNALHIGKVKVSCYGAGQANQLSNPSFTQTVLSNAMFESNNIRNWTTNITLGTWDSNWSSGEITWPLSPQKEINPQVDIQSWSRKYNNEYDQQKGQYWLEWRRSPSASVEKCGLTMTADNYTKVYYNGTLYEQIIPYNELPGNYQSREDFLSHIQILKFNLNINAYFKNVINAMGVNRSIDCDLRNLVDNTMTVSQGVLGINNNDYNPFLTAENKNMKYWSTTSEYKYLNHDGYVNQAITITITTREDGLSIKLEDKTKAGSYNWEGRNDLIHCTPSDRDLGYTQDHNICFKVTTMELIAKEN